MNNPLVPEEKHYTYADYVTWPTDKRCEIMDGQVYSMSPAPAVRHQEIVVNIAAQLHTMLKGKPCRPFIAPIDVVLAQDTVVQPDILVVCDPKKIRENYIAGAPDVVFEVLSPATAQKDKKKKKWLYEQAGVLEYCVVDSIYLCVELFTFGKQTLPTVYWLADDDILVLASLSLKIPLCEIFYPATAGENRDTKDLPQ